MGHYIIAIGVLAVVLTIAYDAGRDKKSHDKH
jgi:hypothetical protein